MKFDTGRAAAPIKLQVAHLVSMSSNNIVLMEVEVIK
jgi:hypothetical protein